MGWTSRFQAPGKAKPADPWDETVINSVRYDAGKATRRGAEVPVVHPDAEISEEVKRRQVALIGRYLWTLRAR
jgi:hypothetical protein